MLQRSRLFRNYENVFTRATGLALTLRPLEFWQLAHRGKKHENPFCALLAERPATLAACLQAHQDMIDHTGLLPHTVTCPFGLTETAIPVKLGTGVIGYLRIGQVLRHMPAKGHTTKVSRELGRHGVKFSGKIKKAWEHNPLIPPDKYNAIVRLLSFLENSFPLSLIRSWSKSKIPSHRSFTARASTSANIRWSRSRSQRWPKRRAPAFSISAKSFANPLA